MTQGGTATAQGRAGTGRRDFRRMGRGQRNPDAALQMSRNMLSETTPEQRAKRREYFRTLMERRRQTQKSTQSRFGLIFLTEEFFEDVEIPGL